MARSCDDLELVVSLAGSIRARSRLAYTVKSVEADGVDEFSRSMSDECVAATTSVLAEGCAWCLGSSSVERNELKLATAPGAGARAYGNPLRLLMFARVGARPSIG